MPIEPIPRSQDGWDALAERLLGDLAGRAAAEGRPVWVQLLLGGDGADTLAVGISGEIPEIGWTAPQRCHALAMVGTGRVHVEDGPADRPAGLRPGTTAGARLACVVARDGALGWALEIPGAEVPADPPSEGRLLDTMRRCLGLATSPPSEGCGPLRAALWIGAILEVADQVPTPLTWNEVGAILPQVRPGWCEPPGGGAETVDGMGAGAGPWSWEDLRRGAVRVGWCEPVLSRSAAAWMDEGMFSRWILDALPSCEDLLASVRPLLVPSAARRLAHVVRCAG